MPTANTEVIRIVFAYMSTILGRSVQGIHSATERWESPKFSQLGSKFRAPSQSTSFSHLFFRATQ